MNLDSFPHDLIIPLENEKNFLGRLTLNTYKETFSVEIDIIHQESRKIFYHVDILYNRPDLDEAIEEGVQKLSHFLTSLKK